MKSAPWTFSALLMQAIADRIQVFHQQFPIIPNSTFLEHRTDRKVRVLKH